jgi:hypothetical protein
MSVIPTDMQWFLAGVSICIIIIIIIILSRAWGGICQILVVFLFQEIFVLGGFFGGTGI